MFNPRSRKPTSSPDCFSDERVKPQPDWDSPDKVIEEAKRKGPFLHKKKGKGRKPKNPLRQLFGLD